MCGILGGVFRRPVTDLDAQVFRRAVRTLAHRGPDAEGLEVVSSANAILAFRRLAIIDLVAGDQPMSTGSGQHIIFNGEIYNYREVRGRLERAGVRFRTASDTEVLLRCLALEGIHGLAELRGMFGFGFLDAAARRLVIARDRLGVKQLYYADTPAGFFFASEPKALIALPWLRRELAVDQLPAYFTFRSVPSPGTLFRGISKLAPGTVLTHDLTTGRSRVERYWAPPPLPTRPVVADMAHAVDGFEAAFLESVKLRLVADVPVGAFLSGGLDSSLVVAAMHRLGHPIIRTFTATFPESGDDESAFARRVSSKFGTAHHVRPSHPADFLAALPRWIGLNDDLVADASSIPLLLVSDMARAAGCIVLLSGEGADELFGGYGSYHKFLVLNRLARLIPRESVRQRLFAALAATGMVRAQDLPRVREYFVRSGAYMGTAAILGEPELAQLLEPGLSATQPARASGDALTELCAFDFVRRIPDDLLVRTDRATMGASIEARVPFLDHRLVEMVFHLPPSARALPGVSKVVLRRLAQRWGVPLQTVVHRKIGFQLPLGEWFRGALRPLWETIFAERAVPGLQYEYVAKLIRRHERGEGQFEEILWRVAALECWHRRWIEQRRAVPGLDAALEAVPLAGAVV